MTRTEEAYASWLNVLGSDPVQPDQGEREMNILRILATSTGDSERFNSAYLDVLLALAGAVGAERAREMARGLVDATVAHRVRYIRGLPLMIDGVDCSPDNVRRLERKADDYRSRYLGQDTVPHWDGCMCSAVCRNRSESR